MPLEVLRRQAEVGRADRLVRFLRVLHPRLVAPRPRVVVVAEHLADDARRLAQRLLAERGRVGAVVGDEAFDLAAADLHALEQPLRDLHRPLGREPELAAGFLRERGRGERRRGPLDAGLARRPTSPATAGAARSPSAQAPGRRLRRGGARCWLASAPVAESKSLPVATRSSPTRTSVAANSRPPPDSRASMSQ